MKNWILTLAALMASGSAMALTPWQKKIEHPVADAPQAVGSFANGCIIGAQPLPLNSTDYQVMRIDQPNAAVSVTQICWHLFSVSATKLTKKRWVWY